MKCATNFGVILRAWARRPHPELCASVVECGTQAAVEACKMPLQNTEKRRYFVIFDLLGDIRIMPLIACVCGGLATRGTESASRGARTVDTAMGVQAYVTYTTLRPRRCPGRRARRLQPGLGRHRGRGVRAGALRGPHLRKGLEAATWNNRSSLRY
jgi:hypothetical protein